MLIRCVLDGTDQAVFTLNTNDYLYQEGSLIETDGVTYKIESILAKITIPPDGIKCGVTSVDPDTGELISGVLPGAERPWSTGMLHATVSVVP